MRQHFCKGSELPRRSKLLGSPEDGVPLLCSCSSVLGARGLSWVLHHEGCSISHNWLPSQVVIRKPDSLSPGLPSSQPEAPLCSHVETPAGLMTGFDPHPFCMRQK